MIPPAATPRILFFADAGASVGGGHVMRCLTLAGALQDLGAVCGFVATPEASRVLEVFAGERTQRVPARGDAMEAVLDAARAWRADAVVVDHYGFEAARETALRAVVRPLVVLDDLRRAHDCDLVLDSNLGRTAGDYPGLESLTGPNFALVRPDFTRRREAALARRGRGAAPRRVLISLGLTDVGAITARVVEALLQDFGADVLGANVLDVVLGAGAPSRARMAALAARDERVRLHIDAKDMPALTAAADLAVGAGGSSVWERCCLGLPSVTVVLADNQRAGALALESAGAAWAFEADAADFEDRLRSGMGRLIADAASREAMSRAAASLCDGGGAARVAVRVLGLR
jgi:UDP-2,4-diacetamido-2,4,6-trideoxy-beta-L-altropyranose hydrolase